MKKTIKLATIALCMSFVGCQEKLDTVSGEHNTAAYMSSENLLINIKKANEGGEAIVEPRLSALASTNTQITVAAQDFLSDYNEKNNTEYRQLPISEFELYEIDNPSNKSTNGNLTVTIKQGEISTKVGVRVKPLDDKKYPVGVKYVIPLSIVSSDAKILSNKNAIVSFNRPFRTSIVEIKQGNNFVVEFDQAMKRTEEFTIQGHFMFLNWNFIVHNWNQSLINMNGKGSNWYYTRVGQNSFQVKDLDADGDATYIKQEVKLKTWYQISG